MPIDQQRGYFGEVQRVVIELKLDHNNLQATIEQGVQQVAEYADSYNAPEAHLIIFNRDPEISWDDKIWHQGESYRQRTIEVWGC